MKNNVFTQVSKMIMNNIINNKDNELTFKGFYPEKAIVYMTTKMKAFKVESIKKDIEDGRFVYKLRYKELNPYSDLIAPKLESYEYKQERAIRKGFTDEYTGCVSTKFGEINDRYRQELECPNYSSERDETGYACCPFNDRGFEQLEPEDNTCLELRLQMLGYDNYADFVERNQGLSLQETMELLEQELQEFYNNYVQPEYKASNDTDLCLAS